MNKNLSLLLNAVLIAAVAVLFYLHFSDDKKMAKKPVSSHQTSSKMPAPAPGTLIAYVDLDSLNEHITYIRDKRKELENEQRAIETEWENSYRRMEAKKNEFLKKGDAITQEMAQQFQGMLLQEQQQVDEKKQSLSQRLNEKSFKFMDDVQKELKEFLTDYNMDKNYKYILTTGTGLEYMVYKDTTLNITTDVIEGMNEKMDAKGKK